MYLKTNTYTQLEGQCLDYLTLKDQEYALFNTLIFSKIKEEIELNKIYGRLNSLSNVKVLESDFNFYWYEMFFRSSILLEALNDNNINILLVVVFSVEDFNRQLEEGIFKIETKNNEVILYHKEYINIPFLLKNANKKDLFKVIFDFPVKKKVYYNIVGQERLNFINKLLNVDFVNNLVVGNTETTEYIKVTDSFISIFDTKITQSEDKLNKRMLKFMRKSIRRSRKLRESSFYF